MFDLQLHVEMQQPAMATAVVFDVQFYYFVFGCNSEPVFVLILIRTIRFVFASAANDCGGDGSQSYCFSNPQFSTRSLSQSAVPRNE